MATSKTNGRNTPPKKVKVLYTTYDVVVTPLNEWNPEPDLPLYGQVEWDKQTIFLDSAQSLDTMRETLWHEIKHIAWQYAGLPKSIYYGGRTEEEDIVNRLSVAELTILKENPELLKFLLG